MSRSHGDYGFVMSPSQDGDAEIPLVKGHVETTTRSIVYKIRRQFVTAPPDNVIHTDKMDTPSSMYFDDSSFIVPPVYYCYSAVTRIKQLLNERTLLVNERY